MLEKDILHKVNKKTKTTMNLQMQHNHDHELAPLW